MILQALHRYAERNLDTPPPLYVKRQIHYLVALNETGTLLGIMLAGEPGRGLSTHAPRLPVNRSGPTPKPLLLADNAEYALGIGREGSDSVKVAARHEAFTALLESFVDHDPSGAEQAGVGVVLRFLRSLGPRPLRILAEAPGGLPEDFDPALLTTFVVDGQVCVGSESARTFWAAEHEDDSSPIGICSVTGKRARIITRMPGSIRGIPGGQPTGTKLVAVNRDAFESMGYEAASGASISRDAAIKVDAALNSLISNPETSFRLGGTIFIHFADNHSESSSESPSESAFEPAPVQALRVVLTARMPDPRDEPQTESQTDPQPTLESSVEANLDAGPKDDSTTGGPLEDRLRTLAYSVSEPNDSFFTLTLAANSSRIIIRDFAQASLTQTLNALSRWFQAQRLVNPTGDGEMLTPKSVLALYQATLSSTEKAEEKAAKVPAETLRLVRAAFGDEKPSLSPLRNTLRYIRLESGPTPERAQLIKLLLTKRGTIPMSRLEYLDSPALSGEDANAYTLGRLLSHLVSIQRSSSDRPVGRNIADRFYSMCQTNPSVGFAKALNLSRRGHLRKLRSKKPGLYNFHSKRLEEILDQTPVPLPRTLSLERQGLFALGYYHQGASARREAQARMASRRKTKDD